MTYTGTVLLDASDPNSTVMWTCDHQHRTQKEARACGNDEAERQNEHAERLAAERQEPVRDWAYWSFASGGLVTARSTDQRAHMIRSTRTGTPGPTLCGIDRFAKGGPGGGYHSEATRPPLSDSPPVVCGRCVDVAREHFRNAVITADAQSDVREEGRG